MKNLKYLLLIIVWSHSLFANAQTINIKNEYKTTLLMLCNSLLERQVTDSKSADAGAIKCVYDGVLHTRAAEAVYPFSVAYKITNDKRYLQAAISTGNWLIRQQQPNGSWKETPEEWTGTTTDQVLMMMMAYEQINDKLTAVEQSQWRNSIRQAVNYLYRVMNPEFASINYVATTTATLAKASVFFKDDKYALQARVLARRTVSKMDEDCFLTGEGGRNYSNKAGVDLGYNMEMSLWGLGYYAKITADTLVNGYVKRALKNHLYFIYPDGSMDNSWGIRSNKWTTYGGATSDGCQVLFSMFANEDPRYATASYKNLQYLRKCVVNGLIGYGPQHAEVFSTPQCIYPTFTKAKNIAFAYQLETNEQRALVKLPTEHTGWAKYFPTLNVTEVRTKKIMATVTAYNYKDLTSRSKSKYMYRPAGGAVSNLWVEGYGLLQASSVTNYSRPEPMSFPEAPGIRSLTPRLEYTDSLGYFTNLFEFDARMQLHNINAGKFKLDVAGDLRDKEWLSGGVGYRLNYVFTDSSLTKSVKLIYHDNHPVVKIIEPFINYRGMTFTQTDTRTVVMKANGKKFRFRVLSGNVKLILGRDTEHYWAPYPALKAYPIEMEITPQKGSFLQAVVYEVVLIK